MTQMVSNNLTQTATVNSFNMISAAGVSEFEVLDAFPGWTLSRGNGFLKPSVQVASTECVLVVCIRGQLLLSLDDTDYSLGERQVFLLNGGDAARLSEASEGTETDFWLVRIPASRIYQLLIHQGRQIGGSQLVFTPAVAKGHDAMLASHLITKLVESGDYSTCSYCIQLLETCIVGLWEFNVRSFYQSSDLTDRRLIKCRDYMLDHLKGDIDFENVANQIGLTARSLYRLFKLNINKTPHEYLKLLKMEAIYRELANPEVDTSVTSLALEYGFKNLGRFSSQYKSCFGELPSVTYKNSRF